MTTNKHNIMYDNKQTQHYVRQQTNTTLCMTTNKHNIMYEDKQTQHYV